MMESHPGVEINVMDFSMVLKKAHRTAMDRMVHEAVLIRRGGEVYY